MIRSAYRRQEAPALSIWTEDQCRRLHVSSLEILQRTGILVYNKEARKIYEQGGAQVKGERVYLPAALVEEALRTAPERIVLQGREGKRVFLEEKVVNYGPGTDLPYFQDYKSGEYRKTSYQDIAQAAQVVDYLPQIDFVASFGIAGDVNPYLADLYHFKAMVEQTEKPLLMTATDGENLKAVIQMAAAVAGGEKELQLNPSFLLYTEPISPLVNSPEAHEKLILSAEHSLPVTYAAGITSGSTGPVTMAGNLALGNAEGLAGLVLHQLVNPGAPFLYGIVPAPMDMKTTICVYGGPEIPLYFCIVGEMGRFYRLPTFGQAGATDSGTVDLQASIDAAFSILTAALSGTSLVHDVGYIGNGLVGSLEMLLLCDETIGMTRRFMEGIPLNEETLALDLIHQVGPGGNYLGEEHTAKHHHQENWYPRYLNRLPYLEWVKQGEKTVKSRLQESLHHILQEHHPPPLKEGALEEMERIITQEEKKRRER